MPPALTPVLCPLPTDAGFLTILVQDPEVPGLEFLEGGAWHLIKPIPGALTINVGDQAQVRAHFVRCACSHCMQGFAGQ